ncbi:MAG: hypothetical protein GXX86_02575 [Propionibacterium sp.]|nr:hypothetical protein [Propionibacterium sp.]
MSANRSFRLNCGPVHWLLNVWLNMVTDPAAVMGGGPVAMAPFVVPQLLLGLVVLVVMILRRRWPAAGHAGGRG